MLELVLQYVTLKRAVPQYLAGSHILCIYNY